MKKVKADKGHKVSEDVGFSVDLPDRMSSAQLSELLERCPYLDPNIQSVEYDETGNSIEIGFYTDSRPNYAKVESNLQELIDALQSARIPAQKTLKSNASEALEQPLFHSYSSAYLDGQGLDLMESLDRLFVGIAASHDAKAREYPLTYDPATMARCGYHKSFPQNVIAMTHIPHDYAIINSIRECKEPQIDPALFSSNGVFLQPCICYHCYEEWRQTGLNNPVLTAKGRCFRHEIPWKLDTFRHNEFTMREIVFIGSKEAVEKRRMILVEDLWALFCNLGLKGEIVTARDPFFYYDDMKTKGAMQLMSSAKYELQVELAGGRRSSVASFNNCDTTIVDRFGLVAGSADETLHSGCVAIGLDRWWAAIRAYHGAKKQDWPNSLRRVA